MADKIKFSSRSKALLTCSAMNNITNIFLSTFWIVHLTSDAQSMFFVAGIYYVVHYAFQLLFYQACAYIFKENVKQREFCYRLGILTKCIFIFLIAFYGEKLQAYFYLMAIAHGLFNGLYWSAYNVMKNSVLESQQVKKFSAFDSVLGKFINIVFPITLGLLISKSTFYFIAFPIFIFSLIQFVASFFVKSPILKTSSFDIKAFRKRVATDKDNKALKKIFLVNFLSGFREGVSTLISILIFLTLGGDKNLGTVTSVGAIFSIITVIIYSSKSKFQSDKRFHFIIMLIIALMCSAVCLVTNEISIILFSVLYTIIASIVDYGVDTNRICILKNLGYQDNLSEFYADGEVYICIARIISYSMLVLTGFLNKFVPHLIMVKLAIMICITSFILLAIYNLHNERFLKKILVNKTRQEHALRLKQAHLMLNNEVINDDLEISSNN